MALCCEIDNIVEIILRKKLADKLLVADIALHEDVTLIALYALEVFKIACVGQLVQIDEQNIIILF